MIGPAMVLVSAAKQSEEAMWTGEEAGTMASEEDLRQRSRANRSIEKGNEDAV